MKKILTLALIVAMAALSGCQKDNKTKTPETGNDAEVQLILGNSTMTKAPSGEEEGSAAENAIKVLEFYVFDQNGNPDTKVGQSAMGASDGNGYIRIADPDDSKYTIVVNSGQNKKFVAAANMELGALGATEKYSDLKLRMAARTFTRTNSRESYGTNGFEMIGESVATVTDGVKNSVGIGVARLTSKLAQPTFNNLTITISQEDIENVWGDGTTVTAADITFDFKGYVAINGISNSDASFIAAANELTIPWADWRISFGGVVKTYINSEFLADGFYSSNYSGNGFSDWFLTKDSGEPVYFYENKPAEKEHNGSIGWDPLSVYAVMIKADLVVDASKGETKTRYWRVNMTHDDDYHILRNCVYKVNIKEIKTAGFGTPKEAETDDPIIPGKGDASVDVQITPAAWRINFYETQM